MLEAIPCAICGGRGPHKGPGHTYTTIKRREKAMENLKAAGDMSEPELTEAIDACNDRLTVLYAARRGKLIPSRTPGHQWAWCAGCGQRMVDASDGADTCSICMRKI